MLRAILFIPLILLSLSLTFSVQASELDTLKRIKQEAVQGDLSRYPEFWPRLLDFANAREFAFSAAEIEFLFSLIELADYGKNFPEELLAQANNGLYILGRAYKDGGPVTQQLIIAELALALEATRALWDSSAQARLLGVLAATIYWPGSRQPAVLRDAIIAMLRSQVPLTRKAVFAAIRDPAALGMRNDPLSRAYHAVVERSWLEEGAAIQEKLRVQALENLKTFREERQRAAHNLSRVPRLIKLWEDALLEIAKIRDVKVLLEVSQELRELASLLERNPISGVASPAMSAGLYRATARQAEELIAEISFCGKALLAH